MTSTPAPTNDDTFDVVIVGAGSAGCALAGRLSEDPNRRILLLEAGGSDKRQEVTIPAAFSQQFKSEIDWNYQTVEQPKLAGRSIYWPRGKVLGGSSSMNAMMWVVGFADDYDRWAELAGPGWSWAALQPFFHRNAIVVQPQRDPRPHTAAFLRGVQEAGFRLERANLEAPDGFTQTLVTQQRGARFNAAKAYLEPARGRKNLVVRTGAHADRVLFEGQRAAGVRYLVGREEYVALARDAVVLCAGAVNTPTILLRSGIGPADELAGHGIPVVVDSPDVGRNLRDHLVSLMGAESVKGTLFSATSARQLVKYLTRRKGMLTSNVAEAYGFVRSDPNLARPDLEIIWAPVAYVREGLAGIPGHGVGAGAILLQPESRGSVRLAGADPFAAPVIDPRYLTDPQGADRARLLAGLDIVQRILDTPSVSALTLGHYLAPEGGERMSRDELLTATLEYTSHTLYHPTSTARMGADDGSVVDPELRVRGVSGLRVADASVMPEIIRGHTHAPSVVIGEKAASLIASASAVPATT